MAGAPETESAVVEARRGSGGRGDACPEPARASAEERRALEAEREFLIRSLKDLEAERAAGELEEADYEALKEQYTIRTAAVLRRLEAPGAEAAAEAPPVPAGSKGRRRPRSWRRSLLIAGAGAGLAGAIAWGITSAVSPRLPGEVITGAAVGQQAVDQALLAAESDVSKGNALAAVKEYQRVLAAHPNQAEALTGEGWILVQTEQPKLFARGMQMLARAERADPSYGPAHLYRGTGFLAEGDYSAAIPELRYYLAHDPLPELVPRVRQALQQAEAGAAKANSNR